MSKSSAPTRRRLPRWLKLLIGVALAVGLYAVLGFWVAPAVLKSQLIKRLSELTQREARVRQVAMNPFALTVTVNGLELVDTNGGLFAAFDIFHADLELASLWQRRLLLRDVTMQVPYLQVVRRADGSLDLMDLVPPADTNAPPSEPPKLVIERLRILNGGLHFTDETLTNAFATRIQPFHLTATNLSTLPGTNATFRLEVTGGAGTHVEVAGEMQVLPDVTVRGSLRARVPQLAHYGGYLTQAMGVAVEEGGLGVTADFAAGLGGDGLAASLTNAMVELNGVAVHNPGETEAWFNLKSLVLAGISGDLAAEQAEVSRITIDGANVHLVRRPDGTLNAETVYLPDAITEGIRNLPDWKAEVGSLVLTNSTAVFTDEGLPEPATLSADDLWLALTGFSNAPDRPFDLHTGLRWQDAGAFSIDAEGQLIPARLKAHVQWEAFDIRPAQPYVDPLARVSLKSGSLAGDLEFDADLGRTNASVATVTGSVEINDFAATEAPHGRDFLEFATVRLSGLDVGLFPHSAAAGELLVKGLRTSLIRMTNGQFNVLALVKPSHAEAAGTEATTTSSAHAGSTTIPPVSLNTLRFEDVSLAAVDEAIPGRFSTAVQTVSGTITGLAWPEVREVTIDLAGRLAEPSPFAIRGTVFPNPKALKADLTVECSAADLRQFTPYSARFLAHPITEGTATATVRYQLDGKQVEGANLVHLDRLTFGEKQDSPDAVDLPVKLGVSLLKDRNGRITFDVPVSGTLDDPEFSIGKVISQTLQNLVTRTATAPFRMLGSLFGGGKDEDIKYVEFDPGESRLKPSALSKLDTLGKALFERPQIRLVVFGGADPATDSPPLREDKLEAGLQQLHAAGAGANGPVDGGSASTSLTSAERDPALFRAYTNRFGVPSALLSTAATTNAMETAASTPPSAAVDEAPSSGAKPETEAASAPASPKPEPVPPAIVRDSVKHGAAVLMELAARDRRQETGTPEGGSLEQPAPSGLDAAPTPGTSPAQTRVGEPASNAPVASSVPPDGQAPALAGREEMEAALLESIEVTPADLEALKKARAEAVRSQLLSDGRVQADRVRIQPAADAKAAAEPRATFELE